MSHAERVAGPVALLPPQALGALGLGLAALVLESRALDGLGSLMADGGE
jgi:hypothetical protein